jgi:hypothetical protein
MVADDELTAAIAEIQGNILQAEQAGMGRDLDRTIYTHGLVTGTARRVLAAVDAVLEMHALTATARYAEPCAAHQFRILPRRTCPDCVRVERMGCQRCRDENGNPAKPEDCAERNAILAALTGKADSGD